MSRAKGVPMGHVLPWVIREVQCHYSEMIQTLPPNVLPPINDPPILILPNLFVLRLNHRRHTGVLVGQLPR